MSRSVASPKKTSEKIDNLNHTLVIKVKRNRRQQATSEFSRLSNLVSKLRCAEEAKCEVAFIGMKSKVQWW